MQGERARTCYRRPVCLSRGCFDMTKSPYIGGRCIKIAHGICAAQPVSYRNHDSGHLNAQSMESSRSLDSVLKDLYLALEPCCSS